MVRVLSIARALLALLAFQLGLGAQMGIAYAGTMPVGSPTAVHAVAAAAIAGDEPCPLHKSADKHDCCKSSGCQGHCGTVPLAFNIFVGRGIPATARVQAFVVAGPAVAPTDTHFRPPIAS